jgi:multiple sugar transport system permease protein
MATLQHRARSQPETAPAYRSRALALFIQHNGAGILFLLPALLIFGFFVWYPIIYGFVLSFQKDAFFGTPSWIGWKNYLNVIHDPLFLTAWKNTFQFALYALLFGYVIPIVLAIAINEMRFGKSYFRLAFYLPVIIPPIVTVFLWKYMYSPTGGLINTLLGFIHVPNQPWLQSPGTAMPSLVIVATWANMGGTMLIYLAALQSIPAQLYEAAELDGASIWRRIWSVTLPQIRGIMLIMLLLQIIATVQIFTEPFTLTNGGPSNATTTIMLLIYNYAFVNADFGQASALSVILFSLLVVLSLGYFGITRRLNTGGD